MLVGLVGVLVVLIWKYQKYKFEYNFEVDVVTSNRKREFFFENNVMIG